MTSLAGMSKNREIRHPIYSINVRVSTCTDSIKLAILLQAFLTEASVQPMSSIPKCTGE